MATNSQTSKMTEKAPCVYYKTSSYRSHISFKRNGLLGVS